MAGTVRLHRVIATSADKVYRAFLEPDAIASWLPPYGFVCSVHELDAKVGGRHRMSFRNFTTGSAHSFGGTYKELVPGQRVVYTDKFDDPNMPGEMYTTVNLKAVSVSVGEGGTTCGINIATGAALASANLQTRVVGKPSFVKDAMWVASGDKLHTTTDGAKWSSRALPDGVRFDLVARSASGTYAAAAASGDAFYYSDDGDTWTKAKAPTGNNLTVLAAGAGSPSMQCPLPTSN